MNARLPVQGERLSPTEYRALRLRAEGLTVDEVAFRTGKAHDTIRNNITAAYMKLGVNNMASAFIEMGWLRVPGVNTQPSQATCGFVGKCGRGLDHRGPHGGFR